MWNSRYTYGENSRRIKFADVRVYDRALSAAEITSGNYLNDNLTNHYTFAGATSTSVPDVSGNNRPATLYNDPEPAVVASPSDLAWHAAMARDFRNHRVVVPGFGQHMPSSSKTIEFWAKMTSSGQITTTFTMLNQAQFTEGTNRVLAHVYWSDDRIYWDNGDINGEGRLSIQRPQSLANGDWTHLALTVNAETNTMGMYANGLLLAARDGYAAYTPVNCDFQIGGNADQRQQGYLSEFRVWSYAKPGHEILADMNKSLTGPKPGLVGCWRLDDADGTIRDRSGNHHHGFLTT